MESLRSNRRPLLEVCASSVDDCLKSAELGADRIELNAALELGGITPSIGLVRTAVEVVPVPLIVMIRPRAGDFVYSEREFDCMLRDAACALEAGASGVAFGILTTQGDIAVERCSRFSRAVSDAAVVFHRAFDSVTDRSRSLELLVEASIDRLLTSGGRATALEGVDEIASLQRQAGERIEILPGGEVRAANVRAILAQTGCSQIHSGVTRPLAPLESDSVVRSSGVRLALDEAALAELRRELESISQVGDS